jgi:glutamate-1-semialdehyde 2,1-aminomutase
MSEAHDLSTAYAARRPRGRELHQRARRVLAGGVGHDLRHFAPAPLYIARAEGPRKWDVDGNEYVDFLCGNGAILLGHGDPEVCEAVAQAMRAGSHFGNDHPLQIEWAEQVCRMVPSAERVRFVNSGSEATALAIRLARAFTGKPKILRFEGHFHGWHDDVVHGFMLPFDADGSLGVPAHVRGAQVFLRDNDPDRVADLLRRDSTIAAAIVEPSGGSWGRMPIGGDFLRALRDLTNRHDVLLLFDEVVTGFRWSPGGAQQALGIRPDLTCLAKVLAGGMPGGAVAGRADIMRLFDRTGDPRRDRHATVTHLGTFNAAPPSAAAGLSVLRRVATGAPTARAEQAAALLRQNWDAVLERQGVAGYVYGPSSTFHVYFETDPVRLARCRERLTVYTDDPVRLKGLPSTLTAAFQRHLRFRGVDVMSSTGGLVSASHTEREVNTATAAFEETVAALLSEGHILSLPA